MPRFAGYCSACGTVLDAEGAGTYFPGTIAPYQGLSFKGTHTDIFGFAELIKGPARWAGRHPKGIALFGGVALVVFIVSGQMYSPSVTNAGDSPLVRGLIAAVVGLAAALLAAFVRAESKTEFLQNFTKRGSRTLVAIGLLILGFAILMVVVAFGLALIGSII